MKQQLETDKDKKFFPDANSTLRVTYGVVKGSNPRDAVTYGYKTHLAGVMEKYVPEIMNLMFLKSLLIYITVKITECTKTRQVMFL